MIKIFNSDFPFSPKKSPVFYGWFILGISTLGLFVSIPGQTIGVSVFTDSLIAATNLSRLGLSNAYLIGTLTSAFLLPLGGVFIDALGSRRTMVISCTCLGISLVLMSFTDYISKFIGSYFIGIQIYITFFVLVLGFASIRFFGQGMVTMTSRTMLAKWFQRKRGIVSGIQGVFVAFGFAVAPYFLNKLIILNVFNQDSFEGWRQAWLLIALIIGVFMNIIFWIFFRDNPEVCDLKMDGDKDINLENISLQETKIHTEQKKIETQLKGFTKKQAVSTVAFWATTMALTAQAYIMTAITFHILSIGSEFGLSQSQTVWIFFPIAFVSTSIGFLIGILVNYTRLKTLFIFMMAGLAMGLFAFSKFDQQVYRVIAITGIGISGGCFASLSIVVLPYFFGRVHLGAIAGMQSMVMVAGSAIGPVTFALLHKLTGTYTVALQAGMFFPLLVIVLLLFVKQKKFVI